MTFLPSQEYKLNLALRAQLFSGSTHNIYPRSLSEGSDWLHGVTAPTTRFRRPTRLSATFHGLDCMMCADDSQLYMIVNPDSRHKALAKLEHCISDI